ncbi:hypothetical protein SR42_00460 [Clostridium botulinum]|uniref:hypothetical protein n=1 Tax=Clostridium botulinum TaxID=1491 RepID=UPI0005971B55|nr:hypothetical protein [Clostridium botulinum]KIL07558.1 hypothetical protein SR42_00460 [Clostridium botulinum]MBY6935442.1 hypothetical protein [Clostridium botulinum]NFL82184.1 hypothetical protein [Clostridium botulinum]NFN12606.1 hypothetical protein [Clostridium botulinum]NFO37772.1 hypothetical protein [Clostridium botulinum]
MAVRKIVHGSVKKPIEEVNEVVSSGDFVEDVIFDIRDISSIHDEGIRRVKFTGYRTLEPVMTKAGKTNRIEADFELDDESVISQSILLLPYSNQLFYKLAVSITGTKERVRLKDLIGNEVMVEIKHNEKDGAVYSNVVDIFAVEDDDYDEYSELEENDLNDCEETEY